jgi:acetolactate synthase small subunit
MAAHDFSSPDFSSRDFFADRSSPRSAPVAVAETVYCFSILAEAEPGVMPRVLELFAKRGLTPTRWHSDVTGPRKDGYGRDLSIDVQVNGLDQATGDYIARCLRQVFQVETVLTSQKHVGRKHVEQKQGGR